MSDENKLKGFAEIVEDGTAWGEFGKVEDPFEGLAKKTLQNFSEATLEELVDRVKIAQYLLIADLFPPEPDYPKFEIFTRPTVFDLVKRRFLSVLFLITERVQDAGRHLLFGQCHECPEYDYD